MQHLTFRTPMPASAEALFAWHERPGAFQRLTPPWAPVALERFEGIRDGQRAVIKLGVGPASIEWVAEHHSYEPGRQFADVQVRGPFAKWNHVHRMEPDGSDGSFLVDDIHYAVPFGGLGQALGGSTVRHELRRQFAYRHRITRADLTLHRRLNPEGRSLRVAISGASGLIGSRLAALLTTGGHTVLRLVRRRATGDDEITWDIDAGRIEADKLEGLDAVIHLAGENVFSLRWSEAKKQRIYRSRTDGTQLLAQTLAGLNAPPAVFVSASAIGYYGDHGTAAVTEDDDPQAAGFLSDVCIAWEAAAQPAVEAGIRTVHPRIGVVLTPDGGALQLMQPAFFTGLGGRIGPADLYLSWIALDDVLGALYHLLFSDLTGPVNLTAPKPATMEYFADTLGTVLRRPTLLNVPASALQTVMGEVADETLLQSARVLPTRLEADGYAFQYPRLEPALRHLLGRTLSTEIPGLAASTTR